METFASSCRRTGKCSARKNTFFNAENLRKTNLKIIHHCQGFKQDSTPVWGAVLLGTEPGKVLTLEHYEVGWSANMGKETISDGRGWRKSRTKRSLLSPLLLRVSKEKKIGQHPLSLGTPPGIRDEDINFARTGLASLKMFKLRPLPTSNKFPNVLLFSPRELRGTFGQVYLQQNLTNILLIKPS